MKKTLLIFLAISIMAIPVFAGTPPYVRTCDGTGSCIMNQTMNQTANMTAGINGINGTNATVDVNATFTGPSGSQASVVNIGTDTNALLDFIVPEGPQGNPGNAGSAATVTVNHTFEGSSPSVVNVGTASDALLDFTIPNSTGTSNHHNLTNLTDGNDHTQYAYLAGRSGGQTLNGGTASGDDLTLNGSSNGDGTNNAVYIQPTNGFTYIGKSDSTGSSSVTGSRLVVYPPLYIASGGFFGYNVSGFMLRNYTGFWAQYSNILQGYGIGIRSVDATTDPQFIVYDPRVNTGLFRVNSRTGVTTSPELNGGTASGDDLIINSSANGATTGSYVFIQPRGGRTVIGGPVWLGTTSGDANASLQIDSTTKAFLPPRMTGAQKEAIGSPVAGMVVYDTTNTTLSVRNDSRWVNLGEGGGGSTLTKAQVCEYMYPVGGHNTVSFSENLTNATVESRMGCGIWKLIGNVSIS